MRGEVGAVSTNERLCPVCEQTLRDQHTCGPMIVHTDLLHFDLRRPFSEWPESVRNLIDERARRDR